VENLRWSLGRLLWQPVLEEYIATSPHVASGLTKQGVFRRIYLIPPTYFCENCDANQHTSKLEQLRRSLPSTVHAIYIGKIRRQRFPLADVMNRLRSDPRRIYELDIYTATPIEERSYKIDNVRINIHRRILSEAQKCDVLSRSHLFVAPKLGTTMDPPLSVLEARYHGNIVLQI
jgi:hypothetical protein